MRKTRAAILTELNKPLVVGELTVPELRSGQVLVAVAYSGLCHTQVLEVRGRRGEDPFLPHTLGHEGSGVVQEVGPGVTKVRPDERVVVSWIKGEGKDVPSSQYRWGSRSVNSGAVSTFCEMAVISENRLTPISSQMPLREAALLGCAVPTGAGAVLNSGLLDKGCSVAVYGAGGVGLCAIMAAHLKEASPIIAVDILTSKLELARELGAHHGVDASSTEPLQAVLALTEGRGVDLALEATGQRKVMELAYRSVRQRGGLCILAGNVPFGEAIAIDPFDLIRGRRIAGTWGGETVPERDIPMYQRLYQEGRLPLEKLITKEYPLDMINEAIEDLERGKVGRALIALTSPEPFSKP